MAWKLRRTLRRGPAGVDIVAVELEAFDRRMREALDAPMDEKRNNELTWPTHKIHYQRNRYIFDLHRNGKITKKLVDYLVKEKVCDGPLMAKWRKPGYERLCSLLAINKSNTNFGTVSVCRTPLRNRTGQIMPNVMTGCVSCASGDGGPIWWDDPVPDIVKRRIVAIDPGKAELVNGDVSDADEPEMDSGVAQRIRALKENRNATNLNTESIGASNVENDSSADAEVAKRILALKDNRDSAAENAEFEGTGDDENDSESDPEVAKRILALKELKRENGENVSETVTDVMSGKRGTPEEEDELQAPGKRRRLEVVQDEDEQKKSDAEDDPEVLERIRKLKESLA